MKRILLFLAVIAIFWSCSKEDDEIAPSIGADMTPIDTTAYFFAIVNGDTIETDSIYLNTISDSHVEIVAVPDTTKLLVGSIRAFQGAVIYPFGWTSPALFEPTNFISVLGFPEGDFSLQNSTQSGYINILNYDPASEHLEGYMKAGISQNFIPEISIDTAYFRINTFVN